MQDQLKEGVKVVFADQLFATSTHLAETMADLAEIERGQDVLEPSAGTGVLVDAARHLGGRVIAVELNYELAKALETKAAEVKQGDFLECNGNLGSFDAVLMNPPFKNADDIKHIKHALQFLKAGGRLVAICADGARQNDQLKPMVEEAGGIWEKLPAGTFKHAGTNVNTVLLSMTKPA